MQYNQDHGITPRQVRKTTTIQIGKADDGREPAKFAPEDFATTRKAAESETRFYSKRDLERLIRETRQEMERAAKKLDFVNAAQLRDKMFEYQKALDERN